MTNTKINLYIAKFLSSIVDGLIAYSTLEMAMTEESADNFHDFVLK